uniref:Uncharacterized protein n=1 Tax=Arundo donax TaxID=35708 RepID=A0A0A9GIT9_ARUDO
MNPYNPSWLMTIIQSQKKAIIHVDICTVHSISMSKRHVCPYQM